MYSKSVKLARVKNLAQQQMGLQGSPRSVFYGDVTVEVNPEDVAPAINHEAAPSEVVTSAIASSVPSEEEAARKVAAYAALSDGDRASRTLLPPLACWNALVVVNPQLGKVLANNLDYMLMRTLNDYPFEGKVVTKSTYDAQARTRTITLDSSTLTGVPQSTQPAGRFVAIPFFRFTIAASTLNAAPGSQISIDIVGKNAEGRTVDTASTGLTYSFQRLNNTEAVVGIFIPTLVVATRTLPFLPLVGDDGTTSAAAARTLTITFSGVTDTDQVSVTIPGYATSELREIASMYSLPSGQIR